MLLTQRDLYHIEFDRREKYRFCDSKNIEQTLSLHINVRNVHPYALNLRSYEYKIHVHKKDYEHAGYLIRDVFR